MTKWGRRKGAVYRGFWTLFSLWVNKLLVCWLWDLQHGPSVMETFASLCERTAFAVSETKCFSMLRGSERRVFKKSILADILNRLMHQCEGSSLWKCSVWKFIKLHSFQKNRARRSPVMMAAEVSLEENCSWVTKGLGSSLSLGTMPRGLDWGIGLAGTSILLLSCSVWEKQ